MLCHSFSVILSVIMLNILAFVSFAFFKTHIFRDSTLQLPLHLSELIMNGQYLSLTGFKSIRVGLIMHGSSFKNRDFALTLATRIKEILKQNNK